VPATLKRERVYIGFVGSKLSVSGIDQLSYESEVVRTADHQRIKHEM